MHNSSVLCWQPHYWVALLPWAFLFSRAAADALVVILGLAFLYRSWMIRDWGWVFRPWFKAALFLWVGLMALVSPFALDPLRSLIFSFGFIRWPLFAAAMAYWLLADDKGRRVFEGAIVVLVAFIMADTTMQYFLGFDIFGHTINPETTRLTGPFNKTYPGAYTVHIFFIALAAVFYSSRLKGERARLLSVLASIAAAIGFVFITGERGAFLILMLGSSLVLFALFVRLRSQRGLMLVMVFILGLGLILFANTQERMLERTIHSTVEYIMDWPKTPSGHSILPAIDIWQRNNHWLGVGIKNYEAICEDPVNDTLDKPFMQNRWCQHPHNIYVEWLVSAGVLGLGGFLIMLVLIFREILYGLPPGHKTMPIAFVLAMLMVVFWPIKGSMSFFSNGIAAIIWMQIGWAMAWMAAWRKVG